MPGHPAVALSDRPRASAPGGRLAGTEEATVELLEQPLSPLPPALPAPLEVGVDELAARRSLREQIGRLERELADVLVTGFPRGGLEVALPRLGGGPRMLSLGELERVRDGLADGLARARGVLAARAEVHERNRQLVERMMLDPRAYRFVRVSREDVGERGCGGWEVRPRLGLLGMLLGWWRVKLSSGCPLAWGRLAPVPGG